MMKNDAISRTEILKYLCKGCSLKGSVDAPSCGHPCRDYREILNTPAIDVAPVVHARWIGGKYYNDVYGYEKTCTACQKEYVVGFDYLYCPYCGARMDGDENAGL